ncbi:response regulator transcription factor [uncultured Alistipes sp.]|uniref:helix-turn-helix transcriptional regulator n=1 Tax=uncultured Alistipes sp. TaxID=538949 RepID=UPI00272A37A1|nr:response regulator transcription factor [uncultured Alistipes sp.]
MESLQREYEELLDAQQFDAGELDYSVLERHVGRLTLLARVANSGITVYDMFRRRHVFASYNFSELFHYDMERIEAEDAAYFSRHIHPDDLLTLHRNGIACLRYLMEHRELAPDMKLINEYRVEACGRYVRVIEQYQVLEFDRRGNIWLSLSMVDVSPNQAALEGVRSQLLNFRNGTVLPFPSAGDRESQLSGREREILRLIGRGKLSKEIADELAISVHTVNTHRQRILEKLNVDNSIEAVRYASEHGLLE